MSLLISHPLSAGTPLYPGTPPVKLEALPTARANGSASTTVMLNTHSGTHLDLPMHFSDEGASVRDALPPLRTFEPTYCIDVAVGDGEAITWEHIGPRAASVSDARALLLRTGFQRHRGESDEKYVNEHPWLDPPLAGALGENFPHLELLGIDVLSAASPGHPDEGSEIHRKLLLGERMILLLEDADLSASELPRRIWRLSVAPVIWEKVDATPVVAWVDPL